MPRTLNSDERYVISSSGMYQRRKHILRDGQSRTACGNLPASTVQDYLHGSSPGSLQLCGACEQVPACKPKPTIYQTFTATPQLGKTVADDWLDNVKFDMKWIDKWSADAFKPRVTVTPQVAQRAGEVLSDARDGDTVHVGGAVIKVEDPKREFLVYYDTGLGFAFGKTRPPHKIKAKSPRDAVIEKCKGGNHAVERVRVIVREGEALRVYGLATTDQWGEYDFSHYNTHLGTTYYRVIGKN